MRRVVVPAALLLLFGAAACGGTDSDKPSASSGVDGDDGGDGGDGGSGDTGAGTGADVRPDCPLSAQQVSDLVGQPMTDKGPCFFGDGNGIASVTITTASKTAGAATYDYERNLAKQTYPQVIDIDTGDKGYLAYKDIQGEAVVISDSGAFTVTMSSFGYESNPAGYQEPLRKILDAIVS